MVDFFQDILISYKLNKTLSYYLSNVISAACILIVSFLAYFIVKKFLLRALLAFISKSKSKWDDVLVKNNVLQELVHVVPACVIHAFAPVFPDYMVWIQRMAFCYIVIIVLLTISKLLDTIDDIYRNFEISKTRPIKGLLQVVKIILSVIGIIVIICVILEQSPTFLLGSIGAASAVLILIFQNSILGFVAGIQLAANDMVRLGDWIEMPKYGADGHVVDITLHTVKVQNWDKTITTIPTHSLMSDSFKNWRSMYESGARRIKRTIYIDMSSIKFCNEEMLERFKKIQYIREYIEGKTEEIQIYNKTQNVDPSSIVNGRHLTNIGTFRAYLTQYLKNHPYLRKDMLQVVRQLQPAENGLPLEIYAFTNDTAWVRYEEIQADIFDHVLAVVPEFDLRIFQNPSGNDLKTALKKDKQA